MFLKTIFKVASFKNLTSVTTLLFGISLASFFGTSIKMDAYIVASNLVIMFNVVFLKAQTKTFIPFIANNSEDIDIKDVVASIIRFNTVFFTVISILLFFMSGILVKIMAPGLELERHILASKMLKVLSVYVLLANLAGIGSGILEYNEKYSKSSLINLIQGIVVLLSLYLTVGIFGIYAVPFSQVLSYLVMVALFLFYYKALNYKLSTNLPFFNDFIKQYLMLLSPIIFQSIFTWLIRYTDTFIASFLKEGSISFLSYCQRISAQIAVSTSAVSMVYFPSLSKLNKKSDDYEFEKMFNKGFGVLFTIVLFITLFVVLFRQEIITVLFERGSFTYNDTIVVSNLMLYYSLVFICAPFGTYLASAYFSRQKTKFAVLLSIISSITNIVLNIILVKFIGLKGLALASSMAFLVGNILQLGFLKKVIHNFDLVNLIRNIFKPFLGFIISFILLLILKNSLLPIFDQIHELIILIVGFLMHLILFVIFALLFKYDILRTNSKDL